MPWRVSEGRKRPRSLPEAAQQSGRTRQDAIGNGAAHWAWFPVERAIKQARERTLRTGRTAALAQAEKLRQLSSDLEQPQALLTVAVFLRLGDVAANVEQPLL